MVTEKSLGWVTDMEGGGDITATRVEAGCITKAVAVVVAAVIAEAGCIMDMASSCSGTS